MSLNDNPMNIGNRSFHGSATLSDIMSFMLVNPQVDGMIQFQIR